MPRYSPFVRRIQMEVTLESVCAALDRLTLTGPQDDCGTDSQAIYNLLQAAVHTSGAEVVALPEEVKPHHIRDLLWRVVQHEGATIDLLCERLVVLEQCALSSLSEMLNARIA